MSEYAASFLRRVDYWRQIRDGRMIDGLQMEFVLMSMARRIIAGTY